MTRNLSVWNSLKPFSVGFDSIFDEFDRMLDSTDRYNSNYPPYNIHKLSDNDYKIEVALAGYSKDDIQKVRSFPWGKGGLLVDGPNVIHLKGGGFLARMIMRGYEHFPQEYVEKISKLINYSRKKGKLV